MATGKRYYWLKLKETFLLGDVIDYLMSQDHGSEYAIMYLMLCMLCINSDGKLVRRVGEVLMPIGYDKLFRDLKYFKIETIKNALELYKQLGLINEESDGVLTIRNIDEMVGYETDYAKQKREQRERLKKGRDNVHTEKDVNTEKDTDKNTDKNSKCKKTKRVCFEPPTIDMINDYCIQKGYTDFNAKRFFNYYSAIGWEINKKSIVSWTPLVDNWVDYERHTKKSFQKTPTQVLNIEQRSEDLDVFMTNGRVYRGKNV